MLHTLGVPALRAEHPFTTAVIAAVPAGGADYRPHADSRSAFEPEPSGDFCRIGEGRGRHHEQARSSELRVDQLVQRDVLRREMLQPRAVLIKARL